MSINYQPIPILTHIFKYFTLPIHLKLKLVCKKYLLIINSEEISGPAPRNVFECILDDSVYHLYKYSDMLNQTIYINATGRDIFRSYFSNYMPESKVYKCLGLFNSMGDARYDNKCLNYILDDNITNNDLINVKKILLTKNIYQRLNIAYDEKILLAAEFNNLNIVEYIFKNFSHYVDHSRIIKLALQTNNLNLLKYMKETRTTKPYYSRPYNFHNINLETVKFYTDSSNLLMFVKRYLKKIFIHKILSGDVIVVEYLLSKYQSLASWINKKNRIQKIAVVYDKKLYQMISLLIRNNINIDKVGTYSKIYKKIIQYN